MEEPARTTSRRSLLGRGLVLVGAALGAGAGRLTGTAKAATPAKNDSLRLYGKNFHLSSQTHRAGEAPAAGDRHNAYGQLLDRPNGRVVGHFAAAHLTHDSPFAATASLEIHTFTLKDGTIHGLGTVARATEGHFVILGGTGRYAGAQGSYVARQHPRELGGDGKAEFHLTLARSEAANGI